MQENQRVEIKAIEKALTLTIREYVKNPSDEVARIMFNYIKKLTGLVEETMPGF